MYLDERNLVSATELNRNPGRYIAAAADGRRLIVMSNNVPTAAIVSMADLRRLDDLDDQPDHPSVAFDVAPPQLADLTPRAPGTTVVGVDVDGSSVVLPIEGHHLVVGATGSGVSNALSALIAGATPTDTAQLEFLVLTGNFTVSRHHDVDPAIPVAVATDLGTESEAQRLITFLDKEISDRTDILRHHKVNTLAEARTVDPSLSSVPDLVIVVDQPDRLYPPVRDALDRLRERDLSIYLWVFDQRPEGIKLIADQLSHRIALRTVSSADSRQLVGTTDAYDDRLPPGGGFVQTTDKPSAVTYVRLVGPDLHTTGEWPSPRTPRSWLPPLPDHVDFDVVNDKWHAEAGHDDDSKCVVPIGLLDDLGARRHTVYTLDLSPGAPAVCVCSTDRALVLNALVSSIINTAQDAVQIYYLGTAPINAITQGPSQQIVQAAVWAKPDQVTGFISAVRALMMDGPPPSAGSPRPVVVIDDLKRLRDVDDRLYSYLTMKASEYTGSRLSRLQLILGVNRWIDVPPPTANAWVLLELMDIVGPESAFNRLRRLRRRDRSTWLAMTARGVVVIAQPRTTQTPEGLAK